MIASIFPFPGSIVGASNLGLAGTLSSKAVRGGWGALGSIRPSPLPAGAILTPDTGRHVDVFGRFGALDWPAISPALAGSLSGKSLRSSTGAAGRAVSRPWAAQRGLAPGCQCDLDAELSWTPAPAPYGCECDCDAGLIWDSSLTGLAGCECDLDAQLSWAPFPGCECDFDAQLQWSPTGPNRGGCECDLDAQLVWRVPKGVPLRCVAGAQ